MKVRFYPRELDMWRELFTFNDIRLYAGNNSSKDFHDRAELIDFLKENGVRLDEPAFPLKFVNELVEYQNNIHYTHAVVQGFVLGWIKELC